MSSAKSVFEAFRGAKVNILVQEFINASIASIVGRPKRSGTRADHRPTTWISHTVWDVFRTSEHRSTINDQHHTRLDDLSASIVW